MAIGGPATTPIGRSAFYAYFSDRFELAEALVVEIAEQILDAGRPWLLEPGDDSIGALRLSLGDVVDRWRKIGPQLRAIADAATQDRRLERIYRDVVSFNDRAVADAIRRDQATGLIDRHLAPDETAVALNQLTLAYLYDRLGRPSRRDLAPIRETLQLIWIRTLFREDSG